MKKYDFGREAEPLEERIKKNIHIDANGCWIWTLKSINKWGYARMVTGSRRDESRRTSFAHRVSYEVFIGKIEPGLTIDHKCKVTRCVNPQHLEAVTMGENNRRKRRPICPRCGSTRTERNGRTMCLPCRQAYRRRYYLEHKVSVQ